MRVYETRPINGEAAAAYPGAEYDPRSITDAAISNSTAFDGISWRRTYIVDTEHIDERNEILTSEERLARERFDIDLLERRAQFIEKPEQPVEIRRCGKRWQPPPEKPYR